MQSDSCVHTMQAGVVQVWLFCFMFATTLASFYPASIKFHTHSKS